MSTKAVFFSTRPNKLRTKDLDIKIIIPYRIDAPKGQYVFVYPNTPQLPLLALRQQDNGNIDIVEQFNNWWNDFTMNFAQSETSKS